MRPIPILLLVLLLVSACAGAPPTACRLEQLAELPVRLLGNVPIVPVRINGQDAILVLDTGSDATVLTRTAARRLGIAEPAERRRLAGAGGPADVGVARLETLGLGAITVPNARVLLGESPNPPLDGVLGIDILVAYELELDPVRNRMALYRARPCADARPPWAGPVTQLATQQQPGSGHLFVPVELDGQPLRGLLDSGASRSTLSLQAAGEAGLSRRRLAALPQSRGQAMNAEGVLVRLAPFRSLKIGPDTLPNPVLAVVDLPAFAGDLLIGSDYLATRRTWFSFLLGRVFVGN